MNHYPEGGKQIEKQDTRISRGMWIKLLVILIALWIFTVISYETKLFQFFLNEKKMRLFLDSLGPFAFVGFILLQSAQVVFAPIPGEVTGLLGGYLYGPVLGTVLSTIGLTLGSILAFSLARIFGRPFVEKFVDKGILQRFDYVLRHRGAFLIFLLFLIPGFPKDYLCYILGLGHLSTLEFIVIGGTGRLFGTILLSVGGTYVRNQQYMKFVVLTVIALSVVLLAMYYRKKIERVLRIIHIRDYQRRKAKRMRHKAT